MMEKEKIERKIKSLNDEIEYLKSGYNVLVEEIKQLKEKENQLGKKTEKLYKILGLK